MTSEGVRLVVEALMIEVQIEIADFVDSRNSDLVHLLSSLMTDSLIHYSLGWP